MSVVKSIISGAREMSMDKFPVPALLLRENSERAVTVSRSSLLLYGASSSVSNDFIEYETMQDLLDRAYDLNLGVAIPNSFVESDYTTSLMKITAKPLKKEVALTRRNVLSYEYILRTLVPEWLQTNKNLLCPCATLEQIEQIIQDPSLVDCIDHQHLLMWLAYKLVDKRRGYIAADEELELAWSDLSSEVQDCGSFGGSGIRARGSISGSVGDVFSVSNEDNPRDITESAKVGSDNFWGDDGYWYRLQNSIRAEIERRFGDYTLRPSTVVYSELLIDKPFMDYAHFDNFPFKTYTDKESIRRNRKC